MKKKRLSPRAKEVKFYMNQHLKYADIAILMGVTRDYISKVARAYGLKYPNPKVYKHRLSKLSDNSISLT